MTKSEFEKVKIGDKVLLVEQDEVEAAFPCSQPVTVVRKHRTSASIQIGDKVIVRNIKQLKM